MCNGRENKKKLYVWIKVNYQIKNNPNGKGHALEPKVKGSKLLTKSDEGGKDEYNVTETIRKCTKSK